jgi:hypothetical protein
MKTREHMEERMEMRERMEREELNRKQIVKERTRIVKEKWESLQDKIKKEGLEIDRLTQIEKEKGCKGNPLVMKFIREIYYDE